MILCARVNANHTTSISSKDCSIQNVGGFLQNVCYSPHSTNSTVNNAYGLKVFFLKCLKTDQFYHITFAPYGKSVRISVDVLCDDDPIFYQACASLASNLPLDKFVPESGDLPCGYLCEGNVKGQERILSTFDKHMNFVSFHLF